MELPLRNLMMVVSYDGTGYHGWQVQPGRPTIQGALEAILAEIEGAPVPVSGSGRTDAGVHALAQVASFALRNPIPALNLRKALNRLLPPDIRALEIHDCDPGFHARFAARAKTYEYRIWRGEICPPFERLYVYHYPYALDLTPMFAAAPLLEGEHDFTAFAAADPKDALGLPKTRTIFSSRMEARGELLCYRVRGSGFLKHMVRNIVGVLIEAGKGNVTSEDIRARLTPGSGLRFCSSAPARGLFLAGVEYDR